MNLKQANRRLNKTWQKLQRQRHSIALMLELSDSEFRLWDLFIALYDWDVKHYSTYHGVNLSTRDTAKILNWSCSKVHRYKHKLIQKRIFLDDMGIEGVYVRTHEEVIQNLDEVTDAVQRLVLNSPVNHRKSIMEPKKSPVEQIVSPPKHVPDELSINSIFSYKDEYRG